MPRLALMNMISGFLFIFLAAAGGVFLSFEATETFVLAPEKISGWRFTLLKSSHAHTNLLGMLQILFALTLPYSRLSLRTKKIQSYSILAGLLAMSFFMIQKSGMIPSRDFMLIDVFLGVGLSATIFAVALHLLGLIMKLRST